MSTHERGRRIREGYDKIARAYAERYDGELAHKPFDRALLDGFAERTGHRPRLVVGKPGLDGHSNGAEVIAVAARHVGFDVVYSGIRLSPDEIVRSAVEEDADLIGVSILSGSHVEIARQITEALGIDPDAASGSDRKGQHGDRDVDGAREQPGQRRRHQLGKVAVARQDEALAASWLERAARGGNAVAQSRLAKLYAAGRGVKLDSVSAAFWYLMARQRGLTDPSLEALVSSLTDEERKQVSERASTWQTGFVR